MPEKQENLSLLSNDGILTESVMWNASRAGGYSKCL